VSLRARYATAWERDAGLYALVLAVSTSVFAALGAATLFWGTADEIDVRFVRWVHETSPDALVETMRVVTNAGSGVVIAPLVIAAVAVLLRRREPGAALFVVSAVLGGQVLFRVLKQAFRRTRPDLEDPYVLLSTYAFPSGHALAATVTYGSLALVLAVAAGPRRRTAVVAAAVVVIALIAASRVVLGVHYLFDVVAGIAAGTAWLAALLLLFRRVRPTRRFVLVGGEEQPQRTGIDA
jgi:membrane-associated phospholipid phosphatase